MKLKRAQTATEYLIILAVVIVIALILVGILGVFPSMGTGAHSKVDLAYWGTTEVGFTNWAIDENGNVTLILKNNMQYAVEVSNVVINGESILASSVTLLPLNEIIVTGALSSGGSEGTPYSYPVSIIYIDSRTGNNYTFTGQKTLNGKFARA